MSFKDIYGQDNAISLLKGYLNEGRLEGGFLFSGPEGIGKRFSAGILAQAANCLRNNLESCGDCPSCKRIASGQHPDVHFIDASTPTDILTEGLNDEGATGAIRIGHIRQLQKNISYKAYEGRLKFFIIDNAHNLNPSASNALLKVLEEPPQGSVIILITDKPFLLFKTIVSRCKAIKFTALNRRVLEKILKADYNLDSDTTHFLAYFSEGRLGKALRLKDTGVLNEKNALIDNFIQVKDFRLGNLTLQKRDEVRDCLNILAGWFRDIYLLKIGAEGSGLINSDRIGELKRSLPSFSLNKLNEIMDAISESIFYLERNINTKLLLYNLRAVLWTV
ncbi:MAG: DNA polymerase III subunit [Candidatus Omnitrophota bacterium]|jgi:DNA polymerase-3 subunit delta'